MHALLVEFRKVRVNRRWARRVTKLALGVLPLWAVLAGAAPEVSPSPGTLRAGAAVVDITPPQLPVHVLGSFTDRVAHHVHDPLTARCLMLDNGQERMAIVIVDSCMMPRDLLDQAKILAEQRTGLPRNRMLMAATHTHSAPAAMGGLDTPPDPDYATWLPERLAEAVVQAHAQLVPARAGWAVVDAPDHTFCRRWIRRPDRMMTDPFGETTVRAHMHPGHESPDVIGPAGPADTALSVLAVQTRDGQPLALLANYSMHYYGSPMLSADYFGAFAKEIEQRLRAGHAQRPVVAMMSQGTSGDLMWMDYSRPRQDPGFEDYARQVADRAWEAYRQVVCHDWVPLGMAEALLPLRFRQAAPDRLAWAQRMVADMQGRLPQSHPEIYAYEACYLQERPQAELIIQALRIGDLGITALPNEVYGITGLKLKAQSPFPMTMNIELANGAEGYIPPPEQHDLGGYTTWAARTAGLERDAEPKIVETTVRLLEQISGQPRRAAVTSPGPYGRALKDLRPLAYWRLEEMSGPLARDEMEAHPARLSPGYALGLEGVPGAAFSQAPHGNRAIHLAGGHLTSDFTQLPADLTLSFWFWNGLPHQAREVSGHLLALGPAQDPAGPPDLVVGLNGTGPSAGTLFLESNHPQKQRVSGHTPLGPKTWHHVCLIRQGHQTELFLDGQREMQRDGTADLKSSPSPRRIWWGASPGHATTLEGKLDEVAVFGQPLDEGTIQQLAGLK